MITTPSMEHGACRSKTTAAPRCPAVPLEVTSATSHQSPSVKNPSGGVSVAYFLCSVFLPTGVLRKHPSTADSRSVRGGILYSPAASSWKRCTSRGTTSQLVRTVFQSIMGSHEGVFLAEPAAEDHPRGAGEARATGCLGPLCPLCPLLPIVPIMCPLCPLHAHYAHCAH
jgi:hypothetical protein